MPDLYFVEQCAPTLAGIKTGSLFIIKTESKRDSINELTTLNKLLSKKGLRAIPLKMTDDYTLIYVYRPDFLKRDLSSPEARNILSELGYTCESVPKSVVELARRFVDAKSFPHEIGLFLGYPPFDVKCFMTHPDEGVKCVGTWKVYGDKKKAENTFFKYKKCTEVYKKLVSEGRPLTKMIVETSKSA
ncbi:MAG: DUF3793 family protein [Lachnospiraceae bacterium]|nr:DUF3793 family protein [Lachnospiraceae bacterium]